jgi:hypothetical protein
MRLAHVAAESNFFEITIETLQLFSIVWLPRVGRLARRPQRD